MTSSKHLLSIKSDIANIVRGSDDKAVISKL